jgi:hypothetical protein
MAIATANRRGAKYLVVIAVVASAVLVLSALLIVPYLTTNKLIQSDSQKRIIAFETTSAPRNDVYDENGQLVYDTTVDLKYIKAGDLAPNTSVWVFTPFDSVVANELYNKPLTSLTDQDRKDILQKIDHYAYYNLIRLPEWLGGSDANSPSAYRAYSAISITQKCLARYWPQDERMRIEDPCAGDVYRSWDGLAIAGPAGAGLSGGFISNKGTYQGLATLNLAVDADGYLLAQRPDPSPSSNGIAGEGRIFSIDQLQESNQELIDAAGSYAGYRLPFVPNIFPDHRLADIRGSYKIGIYYEVNSEYSTSSPVLEAAYSNAGNYESVIIASASSDSFPSLNLDNLTEKAADGSIVPKRNNTALESLVGINEQDDQNCYYTPSPTSEVKIPYSTRFGSDIVGRYAIFEAPEIGANKQQSSRSDEYYSCGSQGVIWGKSVDGEKNIIVHIQTINYDLDRLPDFARSLPIK